MINKPKLYQIEGLFLAFRIKHDCLCYPKAETPCSILIIIIAVNPKGHVPINYELAKKYIAYVVGVEGQKIIADYQKTDSNCFIPMHLRDSNFGFYLDVSQ